MKYDFDTIIDRQQTNSEKWAVQPGELPMTTADMDFKTAPEIMAAMTNKIQLGTFGYEYPTEEYFQAIASWYKQEHHVDAQTDWMRFTTGVVPSITACVNHFSQVGDNVLVMTPVYNIFYNSILNSGRHVIASELQYDPQSYEYHVNWADLEDKLANPLTTLMILCNPHNPIGHVWDYEELVRILQLAKKYGVIVISDEIHGDLVLEGADYTPAFSLPADIRCNVISLVSPSKTFNVAALHAATGIVPNPILRQRFERAINKYEIAEPNLLAIPASIAAYRDGHEWLHQLKAYILANRQFLEKYLANHLPQLHVVHGTATYLVWIDVSAVTDNSAELAKQIRERTGLIINPGTVYHGDGQRFIRINIAYPREQLIDGLSRLVKGIK